MAAADHSHDTLTLSIDAPYAERHGSSHHSESEMREGDPAYSLLMHRTTGYAILMLGLLTLLDRVTSRRYPALRISAGSLWILTGIFLFVRADPEGWPMGQAGFMASWTMPTAGEWLQHKVLSLIPLFIGAHTLFNGSAPWTNRICNLCLAVAALLGAVGLLSHQHRDHPGMDIVNVQHRLFALTALLTAFSLVQERWKGWHWNGKDLLYPACLMLLSFQLLFYVE